MKRCLRITRGTRLRLVLLVVLSLLFQQTAFAAYLCSVPAMSASGMAMNAHCREMPMVQGTALEKTAPTFCVSHCAYQTAATQDTHLPSVPPLFIVAILPAQPALISLPAFHSEYVRIAKQRTSGIPPALRYRVLLI